MLSLTVVHILFLDHYSQKKTIHSNIPNNIPKWGSLSQQNPQVPLSDLAPFQRVSSAFRAFLDDVLALDPKQRPKAHKVRRNQWGNVLFLFFK